MKIIGKSFSYLKLRESAQEERYQKMVSKPTGTKNRYPTGLWRAFG